MKQVLEPLQACLAQLAKKIREGASIIVTARNSNATGKHGRQQAAQDAVLAFQTLKTCGIVDVTTQTPDEKTIEQALASSTDVEVIGGNRWTYWTWSSPDGSIILLVCVGSGTKTDELGVQPFMTRLRDLMLKVRPCLVWAKELDRMGRDELGLGQIVRAIDALSESGSECWLGAGDRGVIARYPGWDIGLYFEGRQYRQQAAVLVHRTRITMDLQTDDRMIDGRARYSLSSRPPTGLGRARLRDERGGKGASIIYLDTPQFRPSADELFEPDALVLDAQGAPADQVDNIRWALRELADRRPKREIAAILMARGFSTPSFQLEHYRGASYASVHLENSPIVTRCISNAILRNLDFFETGELKRMHAGLPVTISDCMPPNGWAESEVFTAIRDQLLLKRQAESQRIRTSLGGLAVIVNGQPGKLSASSYTCTCGVMSERA